MGIFTNDKKGCPICGNATPRLFPTKVEGLPLCKECAAKINMESSMLKNLTINELWDHLDYRKADNLVKADILLYYLSLIYPGDTFLDRIWYPELSFANHHPQILPKLISKRYFELSKCLFGVDTVDEFKKLLLKLTDSVQQMNNGVQGVPNIKIGLLYDSVATVE